MKRLIAVMGIAISLVACTEQHVTAGFPAVKDVQASVEAKPIPTDDILTPGGSARYNAALEAAFDRVHSAAAIVCRNLVAQGMTGVECPVK